MTYLDGPGAFYALEPRQQVELMAYDRIVRPPARKQRDADSLTAQAASHALAHKIRAAQRKRGE